MRMIIKCIVALIISCSFLSCEKETSGDNLIVGAWYTDYSNGGITETFKANGGWTCVDDYYDLTGTYSYDSKSGILVITKNAGGGIRGGVYTYTVLSLTANSLTYMDMYGNVTSRRKL
ncbi:MAG: hypothetical protein E7124_06995 [Bacteroidales bacterium]|nr:hypothetical protein [Bacteroidales bacterium]